MELTLIGFIFYFIIISGIALSTYINNKKTVQTQYSQVILGNRSLNYIATAFSAHASDMSDWLFMAFPAAIYSGGLVNAWIAIGLTIGMYITWTYIAPELRKKTEYYHCITLSTYFEKRFSDSSGIIRILSAFISLLFFAVYIAAGLKGFGFLAESIFNVPYVHGIIIALACVILYIALGGYKALAWIDCFQAVFLLIVIFCVPFIAYSHIDGYQAITIAAARNNIPLTLFPNTWQAMLSALFMTISWAVGYFGTPHILTKFMGMKNVHEMNKAKYIGLTWQISVLSAAGLVGLIGIAYYPDMLANKELLFLEIVKSLFNPLAIGFILSAVAGATLSVITAQVLVLVSVITEDLYHGTLRKNATDKELLWIYRLSIILIALASFYVSMDKESSIQSLVHYAWMGFGCSFGPLVLLSLHSTFINKYGAYASIFTGAFIASAWHNFGQPFLLSHYLIDVPAVIPGFALSICSAYGISWMTKK
jgi:SSS family solute:Na+ symporter